MNEVDRLRELLEVSLEKYRNKEIGLAFSGGLDSGVLAAILSSLKINFKAYVVGTKNSHDIRQAVEIAKELDIKLEVIEVSSQDIEEAVRVERDILRKLYDKDKREELDVNAIPISFNLPLYFIAKNAREKIILLGQGPDEMLGGYSRHEKLGQQAEEEMNKDFNNLIKFGIKQNIATGRFFNKMFEFPYLANELIEFCKSLDFDLKIRGKIRKFILRKLAEKYSKNLSTREKKACQYGSGIIWEMKKLAKKSGHHISIYINSL